MQGHNRSTASLFALILGAFVALPVLSEQLQLRVLVKDQSPQPIPGSKVTLIFKDAPIVRFADSEGFAIFPLEVGAGAKQHARVSVYYPNFEGQDRNVDVGSGVAVIEFRLKRETPRTESSHALPRTKTTASPVPGKPAPRIATPVEFFVDQLQSAEPRDRINACNQLRKMGIDAESASPALAYAVLDNDGGVQVAAAEALRDIGSRRKVTIDALILGLKDGKNPRLQAASAEALGRGGSYDSNIASALKIALNDSDRRVQVYSAESLASLDPSGADPAFFTKLLNEKDQDLRNHVFHALEKLGPRASGLAGEITKLLLGESVESVRGQLFALLNGMGPDAVRLVMITLKEGNLRAIDSIGREYLKTAPAARPAFVEFIAERLAAITKDDRNLSRISAPDLDLIYAMIDLDESLRPSVLDIYRGRFKAITSLLLTNRNEGEEILFLKRLLELEPKIESEIQAALLEYLIRHGYYDSEWDVAHTFWLSLNKARLVSVLRAVAFSDNRSYQPWTFVDLVRLDPESRSDVARYLAQHVLYSDEGLRIQGLVLSTIQALGPAAAEAVPNILRGMEAGDSCAEAGEALSAIGESVSTSVLQLVAIVNNPKLTGHCHQSAALVLGKLGPLASQSAASLVSLIKEGDCFQAFMSENLTCYYAKEALLKIGTPALGPSLRLIGLSDWHRRGAITEILAAISRMDPTVIDMLIKLLSAHDGPKATEVQKVKRSKKKTVGDLSLLEWSRIGAAETLGKIGPAAQAAVPTLKAITNSSSSEELRVAATAALSKIE